MHNNSTIPVVIFCGGKGTRLKEETDFKPKPMVTIGGRPILWHIMKIYASYGYKKFILCLGYKSTVIKDYFLNHKLFCSDFRMKDGEVIECYDEYAENDFEIIFAETGEETLTGERLLKVQKYIIGDQFMVTYGDGVSTVDVGALLQFHTAQQTIGTLTGVHPTSKWGLVDVDSSSRVTVFQQKPHLQEYVNGGYMVFQKKFFSYLRNGEMVEETLARLVAEQQLSLYTHDGYWHAMDTYQDYEALNKQWATDPKWKIWEK